MNISTEMTQEDAIKYIIKWIREGDSFEYSNYGYDIYIPNVIRSIEKDEKKVTELSTVFFDAAWELCRRGIIRPGVKIFRAQHTEDGSAGCGFSITPFGKTWINEENSDVFIPTEPERFAQMLKPFSDKFGSLFHQRAQEAVRCYGAHAYLACCAMCGASAESILLTTAIAKYGDENHVLREYRSASGRRKIEQIILGKATDSIKREFSGFTGLLKYWRDSASHGAAVNITENEAYTSLALLLRFAMFVNDHWDELTK